MPQALSEQERVRGLSDAPAAIRMRNMRARRRERQGAVAGSASASSPAGAATLPNANGATVASGSSSSAPLHETTPVTGPGPEAFAVPPLFPAGDGGEAKPFAGPETEPPPPPKTPEEVAGVAIAVAMYFQAGAVALLARHREDLIAVGIEPDALVERMPLAIEFVRGSAERVCIKYGIALPYQDEIVVAGALGIATFGLFGGKKKKPSDTRDEPEVANGNAAKHARDANPKPNANGAANANANTNGVRVGPPRPPMGTEGIEDNT